MITNDDGRYCPAGYGWFNPWYIRKLIAEGGSTVFCFGCGKDHDIDELLDSGEYKELNE